MRARRQAAPRRKPRLGTVLFVVTLTLAVAAVWAQLGRAGRLIEASKIVQIVEGTTAAAQRDPRLGRSVWQSNLRVLARAAALAPTLVDVPTARGMQYFYLDRPEAAERAFRGALELEPRAESYANLGLAQWKRGDREEALASFRSAVVLDPNYRRQLRDYLPEAERAAPPRRRQGPSRAGGG